MAFTTTAERPGQGSTRAGRSVLVVGLLLVSAGCRDAPARTAASSPPPPPAAAATRVTASTTPRAPASPVTQPVLAVQALSDAKQVTVRLSEFHVALSRDTLRDGNTAFVVQNAGQREHSVLIRGDNGMRWRSARMAPGASVTMRMPLPPGRYTISSTDSVYTGRGMHASLIVR